MLGLFDSTHVSKLTNVKRKYLERSVALVNTARKVRQNPPNAYESSAEMGEWRRALAEVDKFIDLVTATKEPPPEEEVTKQFRRAAKAILKWYGPIPKSFRTPMEENEIRLLLGGRDGDTQAERNMEKYKVEIAQCLKNFTKGDVKLQVVSVKSPILYLPVKDKGGKSTDGPFNFRYVKISKLASVDWLLLQLHIKGRIPSTANSHAYSKTIKRDLWFANKTAASSVGLANTMEKVIEPMEDKMLTIIPERRWVLVVVPLQPQARQTFGNFWDTQENQGELYVTQRVFGEVAVYDPPHDAKLKGFLKELVKNNLPLRQDKIESIRMVRLYEERQNEWEMELIDSKNQVVPPDSILQPVPTSTSTHPARTGRGASPSVRSIGSTTSTMVGSLHSGQTIVNTPSTSTTRGPAAPSRGAEPPSALPAAPVTTSSSQSASPAPPAPAPSPAKKGFISRWFGGGSSTPTTPVSSGIHGSSLTEFATLKTKPKSGKK